jgi:hypothetical protein
MPNEYIKNGSQSFTITLNANTFYVLFFVLLVLKVIPLYHPHHIKLLEVLDQSIVWLLALYGNRIMGGIVWLLALALFMGGVFRCYESPPGWLKCLGTWIQENKLTAFFWILLVSGLIISSLNAFVGIQETSGLSWEEQRQAYLLLVSALASYSFLFISYGVFRLYFSNRNYLPVLFLLILVNLIPFWQKIDFASTRFFMDYTIGGYINYWIARRITSVLDAATTYSAFAAVTAVFFWGRFLTFKSEGAARSLEFFVAVLAMAGALLAGSRTGILSLLLGFMALFFYVSRRKKWWMVCAALMAVVLMHVFALWHPFLGKKVGEVFPYVNKLRQHEAVTPNDFVPDFSVAHSKGKGGRWNRIKQSFDLWQKNPWFGIGLGQYNVISGHEWKGNVHNLFMNILCEAGIFVFVAWLYLVGRFVWRFRRSYLMAVVVSIFVVSCFENLFDHSLPWVLTCAWIFSRDEAWVS